MPLVPSARRRALAALLPLALAAPLAAQDTTRAGRDTVQIQEFEVKGVRQLDFLRNVTTVPVDRIPLKLLGRVGQPELSQILNFALPSLQSVTQSQTDGNDHVDFAQVRGLGADQVLVLVNGKRRHQSALLHLGDNIGQGTTGVDLNSIPAAAIERVEFLRDGAAAQYGSDAIAGVINIVLKSGAEGGTLGTLSGITSRGDGASYRVDGNYGLRVGTRGFVNLSAEFRHRNPTNRVGRWNGNVYFGNLFNFGDFGPNGEYNSQAEYDADVARIAARGFDRDNVQRIGDSRLTNTSLWLNSALPVGDSSEAYAFGGLTFRRGEATAFYRFPADLDVSNLALFPDGYLPFINTNIGDQALTAGIRSTRRGWTFDVSNTFGANRIGFVLTNTINPSLRDQTPTNFDAGALRYQQNVTRVEATKRWTPRGLASATLAVGSEVRVERYRIQAGEEASWKNYATGPGDTTANGLTFASGSQGFPGFQPRTEVDRTRTNAGAYLDGEVAFDRTFTVGLAGRYEDYSDFGDRATGKVAARWRPTERVTLRGSFNTGFRAPSLPQTYSNRVSTIFVGNRETVVGLFNNISPVVRALGVAPLRPERSSNWSAGFLVQPAGRLTLSADGYLIRVNDRIVASGVLGRDADPAIDGALAAFPDIQSVQFFSNAIDTRTIGLDLQASYPIVLGEAVLTVAGTANFNKTEIRGAIRRPTGIGDADLFNPQERSWIENALPRSKVGLSARYERGGLAAFARTTRFGAVESINLFGPNETVPAGLVTDLNVAYTFKSGVTVAVGGNNVFDKLPPVQDYANSYFGIFKYSRVAPYGIRGASFYGSVSVGL